MLKTCKPANNILEFNQAYDYILYNSNKTLLGYQKL